MLVKILTVAVVGISGLKKQKFLSVILLKGKIYDQNKQTEWNDARLFVQMYDQNKLNKIARGTDASLFVPQTADAFRQAGGQVCVGQPDAAPV